MSSVDRAGLADFLRRRRERIRPAAVGLAPGPRRRTPGLRREEVAQLTGMSVDYYVRLEQARSTQPSPQMLRALARTLRLSDDERDHLFVLAGHDAPPRHGAGGHVRPGVLHVLDRLVDSAAFVVSDTEVVLAQNRMAVLLLGDGMAHRGLAASGVWRWFTDPSTRARFPAADHAQHGRVRVAELRRTWARRRTDADVAALVDGLLARSAEFRAFWAEHDVAARHPDRKRILHPVVGPVDVHCEVLLQPAGDQSLVLLTAEPGSEDQHKLDLLGVVGTVDSADGHAQPRS
jgi:transcriptional regulator with XRE-family HTH domain